MPLPTLYPDAIMRANGSHDGLFPELAPKFLVRQVIPELNETTEGSVQNDRTLTNIAIAPKHHNLTEGSQLGQRTVSPDLLVRLPKWHSRSRVTVLQEWVGRVECLETDHFKAVITDVTNSGNPPEEVELGLDEISDSDRPLLADGAIFYWSIGYRTTPGGQRERVSALRLARQPRLTEADVRRAFEEAERAAAFLQSD